MKSANRYKENTMKNFNRYATFSLRAVLAATIVMFGIIRSNDYVSRATPSAFAAEQTGPGALQWRQTSGPEGANIISLLSNGSTLFAGTMISGVFRSTNQGESWTAINAGLSAPSVQSLVAVGQNIFAGTGGDVFRLIDQEERWVAVNTGLTETLVTALAVSGMNIFAATPGGVFRSSDQGESWTQVGAGLPPNASITSFAAVGPKLFAAAGGVFLSTDQGESWIAVNAGLTNLGVRELAVAGEKLFAGTFGVGVFVTDVEQ